MARHRSSYSPQSLKSENNPDDTNNTYKNAQSKNNNTYNDNNQKKCITIEDGLFFSILLDMLSIIGKYS